MLSLHARSDILKIATAAVVVAFALGAVRLVMMRFEAGNIYPPYSSLRTDPLGTKAFYDGLSELAALNVSRNYTPLDRFSAAPLATLMYIGIGSDRHGSYIDERQVDALAAFVSAGGRLVVSLPADARDYQIDRELGPLLKRFGAAVKTTAPGQATEVRRSETQPGLARFYFDELADEWKSVYLRDIMAVIIERRFGKGTVVFSGDSYYMTNEAVWRQRRPSLLAWLVGAGREVIFDETHLGVVQQVGIAALGRRYGLAGTMAVLAGLGILAIWKGWASFLPRSDARAAALSGAGVSGKGSQAALLNLLRRSISHKQLLAVCLQEWRRAARRPRRGLDDAVRRVEAVVQDEQAKAGKHRDTAAAYRRICRILSERKL